jgi:transposase-like protein
VPTNSSAAVAQLPPAKLSRVPEEVAGIQVNFCKNPACANFGVPVAPTSALGRTASNAYTVVAQGKGLPVGRCNLCGEHFPFKSNQGVFEEFWRIHAESFPQPCCPDTLCSNHRIAASIPKAYQSFGGTALGSKRYRCKACGKTFSVKPAGLNPIRNQIQSDKNPVILRMLMGKMPLRRICEAADVTPPVLYQRIDFFHEQARAFLAHRERKLADTDLSRLYIRGDRQDYAVNWTQRKDKRNVVISAVSSADNGTGYVFGMHANFDLDCDPMRVEAEAVANGDTGLPMPHRKFARLWLQADYDANVAASLRQQAVGTLSGAIAATYVVAGQRSDVESPERFTGADTLPTTGMQVHSEYTLYGHFLHLNHLLAHVGKIRFFLDQDSGMRAACLGAFADRIKARDCDAFYVRIAKKLTVDEKRRRLRDAEAIFHAVAKKYPGMTERHIKLHMLKERIAAAQAIGQWKDRWVLHPLPSMSEPEKALCYLTDFGDYDADHLAWLYNKASLHAVDCWFNRIRRRSSLLERSISSSANRGRMWNGYSVYRPEQIGKILTILRACHNYVWPAVQSKNTPAMRLGLAKAPLDYKNIIYFA